MFVQSTFYSLHFFADLATVESDESRKSSDLELQVTRSQRESSVMFMKGNLLFRADDICGYLSVSSLITLHSDECDH